MSTFEVRTINSLEALESDQARYNDFLDRAAKDTSFHYRPSYLKTYLDLTTRKERLSFYVVIHQDRLVAVAPFVQILQKWSRFWIKRLEFIGASIKDLRNEHPAILVDPDVDQLAILNCLVSFLQSSASDWDQLDLSGLVDDAQLQFFQERMNGAKTIPIDPGFQTVFPDGLDKVIDHDLSKGRMREVRRLGRKILRDHPSAIYRVDYGLTEELFDQIFSLHSERQQVKRNRGAVTSQSFFDDPERRRRMKSKLMTLAEIAELRLYRFMIDDQMIAFNLVMRSGATVYGLFMAFDQAFFKYSPSKVLLLHIMQTLDEEGIATTIDHMSGPSLVKTDFCNVEFTRYRLVAYNQKRLTSFAKHNCYLATRGAVKFGAKRLRAATNILRSTEPKSAGSSPS